MSDRENFRSNKTFEQEVNWIVHNIPDAILSEEIDELESLRSHFEDKSPLQLGHLSEWRDKLEITPINTPIFFPEDSVYIEFEEDLDLVKLSLQEDYLWVNQILKKMGPDGFGVYLPRHIYLQGRWGIFLFIDQIESYGQFLASKDSHNRGVIFWINFFRFCIYRHMLFHFHLELFATAQEVLWLKPLYLKYRKNIYEKTLYTAGCLEESLADYSVMKSRLVGNRAKAGKKEIQTVYGNFLKNSPSGNRDYACTKHGGPKIAHKKLVYQILHGDQNYPLPTSILLINKFFSVSDKVVPVYAVKRMSSLIRLQ